MKTTTLRILLLLFAVSFTQAQEAPKLPAASQEIRVKLEAWEEDKRANLDAEIAEQRQKVVLALEVHLEQATRKGDLDGAIAIRSYIKSLRAEASPPPKDPEALDRSESLPAAAGFEEWVMTVEFSDGDGTWVIEDDRLAQYVNDGRRLSYKLNPIDSDKREVSFTGGAQGATNYFRFDRNLKQGERVIEPSGRTHKLTIKPKTKR